MLVLWQSLMALHGIGGADVVLRLSVLRLVRLEQSPRDRHQLVHRVVASGCQALESLELGSREVVPALLHLILLYCLSDLCLCQVAGAQLVVEAVPGHLLALIEPGKHVAVAVLHLEVVVEDALQAVGHVDDPELGKLVHDELQDLDDGVHLLGHVIELLSQVLVLVLQHVDVLHARVLLLHQLRTALQPVRLSVLASLPLIPMHCGSTAVVVGTRRCTGPALS